MRVRSKLKPRKRPTQERARHTVEAILQATTYILVERGYDALTTNHVATRAGVNIATLYQYFPGKEAILAELVRTHAVETRAAALEVLRECKGRSLAAIVRATVMAAIAAHRVSPTLHRILTHEASRLGMPPIEAPTDPELARLALEAMAKVRRSAEELARALWMTSVAVHALIHQAILERPGELDRPEFAEELTCLVTSYLRSGRRKRA